MSKNYQEVNNFHRTDFLPKIHKIWNNAIFLIKNNY